MAADVYIRLYPAQPEEAEAQHDAPAADTGNMAATVPGSVEEFGQQLSAMMTSRRQRSSDKEPQEILHPKPVPTRRQGAQGVMDVEAIKVNTQIRPYEVESYQITFVGRGCATPI